MTSQSPSLSSSSSSSLSSSSTTTMPNQISSTPSSSTIFHVNNIKNHIPEVLDFTNYLIWKTLFLNILHCHQVQNHIDGTSSCPSSTLTDTDGNVITNPAYSVWKQIDYIVLSWLHATISSEILKQVLRPGESLTAYETWCQIETLFHDHVNAKYLQLKLSFNQASIDNRSMVDYLNHVKTISDSLYSISHPIDDNDIIL